MAKASDRCFSLSPIPLREKRAPRLQAHSSTAHPQAPTGAGSAVGPAGASASSLVNCRPDRPPARCAPRGQSPALGAGNLAQPQLIRGRFLGPQSPSKGGSD